MQGKKKEILSRKWILDRVNAYSIYKHYIPGMEVDKKLYSPFRKEYSPSFMVYFADGELYYKDYGLTDCYGDVFSFVGKLFGVDFPTALEIIAKDFGLVGEKGEGKEKARVYEQPVFTEKESNFIQVETMEWTKAHQDYFKAYFLAPRDLFCLPDTSVYPIKEWALNRLRMPLKSKEIAFAYNLVNSNGDWLKIYRPYAPKEEKWRSSIPFTEIMGIDNMRGCELGIITKSVKDAAVIAKYIIPSVCVTQAEDPSSITNEYIELINSGCNRVYVSFDNDKKGIEACKSITSKTGWNYINPPKNLLKEGITDWSDWIRRGGPNPIIDFFKQKGVIK